MNSSEYLEIKSENKNSYENLFLEPNSQQKLTLKNLAIWIR